MRTYRSILPAFLFVLLAAFRPAPLPGQNIVTTVAGGGPNNEAALSACIGGVQTVAVDPSGNIYIGADQILMVSTSGTVYSHRPGYPGPFKGSYVFVDGSGNAYFSSQNQVYRVDAGTGIAAVVAGTGTAGFSGDGGLATSAKLNGPAGIATDSSGNIYIADYDNGVIRKVDSSSHAISTIAGTAGSTGYTGDGGLATAALLNGPISLAVDALGNIYISDSSNQAIRKITASTGKIDTLVKNPPLLWPRGIALDTAGDVFIADTNNSAIREYVAASGAVKVVAGGNGDGYTGDNGPATSAKLNGPEGVWVDASGNIYIADYYNDAIRKVDALSGHISTIVGPGTTPCGEGGPATDAVLHGPFEFVLDSAGDLFTTDFEGAIRKVDATTSLISTVLVGLGNLNFGVAADSHGNVYAEVNAVGANSIIYKLDVNAKAVTAYAGGGSVYGDGGPATSAAIAYAEGLFFDGSDNLFIVDSNYCNVREVDAKTGYISTVAGSTAPDGASSGTCSYTGDKGPATKATLKWPSSVFVDALGNIYIADYYNGVIRKVDATTHNISTVAGNGKFGYTGDGGLATNAELNYPYDVVVDAAGNLYISDSYNYVVRKVDGATGVITTVAGNGVDGFNGEGVDALSAEFGDLTGLAISYPDLLVGDLGNWRIRKIAGLLAPPVAPTVTTDAVTNITATTATSGGNVTSTGGAGVTARGVCWNTGGSPTTADTCTSDGDGIGAFTSSITGLATGSQYHVRAYAINSKGTGYGADMKFTAQGVPTVTTTAVTAITTTTAASGGNVTADGGAAVTARGVCWNTGGSPTTADTCTSDGTGTGAFTSSIAGLTAGSPYHVRAYATNSTGTSYGTDMPFTTLAVPTVTTTAVTSITTTTAASGGNVTSDGGASVTARGVCWNSAGNPTTSDTCTNNGTGTGAFTSSITGLTPGSPYHVRAYATNSAGTAYGADVQFTATALAAPTLGTTAVTAITQTTAASGGNITSDGGAAVTKRGVCWNSAGNPTTADTFTSDGTGTGAFTSSIAGLTAGTPYHVRAYATNSVGTSYGGDLSFSTAPIVATAPTLTTTAVSAITTTTAVSGGNITSDGGATVTKRGVCWGATANPTTSGSCQSDPGTGIGTFSVSISGLTAGSKYHLRAYATNTAGTAYGSDVQFTTSTGIGPFAYITNSGDNTVTVIDTLTNLVYGAPIAVGSVPLGVAVNATGTRVYVANVGDHNVNTIDTSTNKTVSPTVSVEYGPIAVAINPVNTMVYTADEQTEDMGYFDASQNVTTAGGVPMDSGAKPDAVAVSPDGSRIYVANLGFNSVTTLDSTTYAKIGTSVAVRQGPDALALSPDGTRLYVGNGNENTVSVIDTGANAVIGSPITVGNGPRGIAVNPSGTRAWVTNYHDDTVSVIDMTTNTVSGNPILVGQGPWGIAINPAGTSVYVANYTDGTVSVLDAASNQVVATIVVGSGSNSGPAAFGQFIRPPLSVVTSTATALTYSTAAAKGNVTMDGGSAVTVRGVCWGATANPSVGGNCLQDTAGGTGIFNVSLSGLTASTAYHLRTFATNSYGTVYGADVQFTTLAAVLPSLTTTAVSNVAQTTATSGGNITSDGGAAVTARGVCWNSAGNPTTSDTCTSDGTGTGAFTSSITGLKSGSQYHVRAYATNTAGTAYGSDLQFSAGASVVAPTVTVTPSLSSITTAQALKVTVAVSGGSNSPTPTGSVTLSSGSYNSGALTLSNGGATINIPAGSLATGIDTLSVSYTPDSASSSVYKSASGSNTVTVAGPPAISTAFGASSILLNGSTSLSFTITNPNATTALTGVGFSDGFPAGLAVAASPKVSSNCGGTFTAAANSASVSLSGGSIAVSGSCTISLTVTGTAVGIKNNTTKAVSSTNGGTGNTASASLTVNQPPAITSANHAAFTLGVSSSFTVTTTGFPVPSSIAETGALPNGVKFTNNNDGTATLAGTPTTGGTFNLTLTASNGVSPNATQSFTLTVNGPVLSLSPQSNLDFGTVYLGSITTKNVTVGNTGNQPITITNLFISIVSGGDSKEFVAVNLCPKSLPAGKSCTISITFVAGPFFNPQTATLSVTDNAPGSPQTVNLTASVIDPQAQLSLTSWNFGTWKVKTTRTAAPFTLTNTGLTPLKINSIAMAGNNPQDFGETNNCPSSLAVNASCTINISFTPLVKGPLSASVVITDNAKNSPQTISLTGTGN